MKKISVCIPVYNEEANLPRAVEAIEALFRLELSNYESEILITDNASSDSSWKVAQDLSKGRKNLKAFRFSRNFGYQNSVFAGLSLATGDAVIELDADLEDPPSVIPEFVKKWEDGFDVAYGVRRKRFSSFGMKILFSLFYKILNKLSSIDIPQNAGDFRLLDRRVVNVLKNLPERNLYLRGLVTYLGFRQCPVQYDRDPRATGKSKFRLFQYFVLAIDALTAFSKVPLRLTGLIGLGLFFFSMLLAAHYLTGHFRNGTPIPGFTTLVVLVLFLHSITFIVLGVLGEYLSRIFDDSKFRPRVIIADAIHSDNHPTIL